MTESYRSYEFRMEGEALYALLRGRLGAHECPQLEEELEVHLIQQPQSVVFDLKETDFVFSAFLRVCIRVSKRLEGGRLSIINASPPIKEVLVAAGLDRVPVIHVE